MQLKKRLGRNRFRPHLEQFESRLTPSATTRFASGTLSILVDNASTTVALTQTASNTVQVVINGSTVLNAANVANIQVNAGNGVDTVSLALGTFTLGAGVNVTIGSGTGSAFNLTGGAGGAVAGRLTVNMGNASSNAINLTSGTVSGQATFGGSSAGTTTLTQGATNTLLGNDTFTRIASASIAGTVNGLTFSNSSLGVPNDLTVTGSVLGNLYYTGGSGTDTATLSGTFLGNTTINDGIGTATVDTTGGTFSGTFSLIAGNSANTFTTSAATTFDSNLSLTLGNGANTLTMPAFVAHGNVTIRAGNGGNTLSLATAATTIDGNLSVTFGNGTNSFTITTGNLTFHGASINYTGGTGADTVTVSDLAAGSSVPNLIITTGGGNDTVNLGGITLPGEFGLISVTFGTFGTKSWTPPAAGSFSSFSLTNFP
jgi:hypothetical protein